jgi:polyphosphate glucokinase
MTNANSVFLGIDIGGSGIKGAPVDVVTGTLLTERFRIPTPQPATPQAVAEVVGQVARHFDLNKPIGCTFPAVIKQGVARTAANVDKSWIGTNAQALFEASTGCPAIVLNDADAAGIAEMQFGAGKGEMGVVLMITVGTGIGSALFLDGRLVPNTELGHMEIRGKEAEHRASDRVREQKKLSWDEFANRLDEVLDRMHALLWPDLIIVGGGVSKKHEKYFPQFTPMTRIVPAQLLNNAGIVGAALAAAQISATL